MLPSTIDRVPVNTADDVNRRIRRDMEARLVYYERHPEEIAGRLEELDAEWDVERMIEANASTLAFAGVAMAATVDRRWIALTALVTAFLLQHSLQGWCPPVPVLRRLGFRTAFEISRERYALKALRGDFDAAAHGSDRAAAVLAASAPKFATQPPGPSMQ